ncbi:MAG: aminotransferase class I/II-fold pyridoxal phosphate-dependent enzyme [Actinobacteria bacterium]|nr:aminotransferase class I/II-fold pyridoxal phosphate-dependent enzyme [Actinomycetota bacterium]MCB9411754.1 aminotransferase class I/II-fold pyridoxal phosphate-dependent enzyme [Actinomycetota bacterium]
MRPHSGSVFGEFSALAARLGAVNLGQGFPDTDGPDALKEIAIASIAGGSGNQYPPRHGLPDLLAAVCDHQRRFYGLDYDPATEAVIGTGASELITAAILALVDHGDEVIVPEPWFDVYGAGIAMAGAEQVGVPLARDPERGFRLDVGAIADAVTDRTTAILLNTPHNPTGAVFDEQQLAELAEVVEANDLIVISDEVYEHLVFGPDVSHVPMAAMDGMRERTVTLGSGGKTFSFTGWKVGWATGPADLISAVRVVRQHLSYVSGGPFQPAIAAGLRLPESYFAGLAAKFGAARRLLADGLSGLGLEVVPSGGSYFFVTDVTGLGWDRGESFVEHILANAAVVAIPVARLSSGDTGNDYVRWTFSKRPEVLSEALRRLGSIDLHNPAIG